ncbi:MAG: LysR family transcriptional regulator [Anaerolineales bacterium]|nr:LysR family transcriptional regulator [Anaerolineales bacterium]
MKPRWNLWIERKGDVVMSAWRIRLLEAIAASGSISSAALEMDIPYRLAWERIHEMEKRLKLTLVDTAIGGVGGGGANLTDVAHDLIKRFHAFADGLDEEVELRYKEAFEGFSIGGKPVTE